MDLIEAVDKVISVIQLNDCTDGVMETVSALWDDLDLSAEDLRKLAIEGMTERVIRVAYRRRVPLKLQRYTDAELRRK